MLSETKISVITKPNKKIEKVYWAVDENNSKDNNDGKKERQLIVEVNAPPIEGKANKRVGELIANFFAVAKSNVKLIKGEKSKNKVFIYRSEK